MSASIKNLYQFRTTSKITQAQGATSTFTVGNDIFTNSAVSITGWSIQLTNRTWSQVELFIVTVTAWVATIASRGIKPDGTTDTIYQYERPRNTLCTVTVLENQITNKIDTNTFTQDQTVTSWKKIKLWASAYVWTENDGTDLKFKDGNNTEKTLSQLASLSGSNDKVKISATDTTEAFLNSKITAGDWLSKTTINPAWNEVLDLDIDLTDTAIFATDGTASKAVVTDGSWNIFQATTTKRWGAEMNTDAEAYAWTDETRYINAKQRTPLVWILQTTRAMNATSGTVTVAHWLWYAPKYIIVTAKFASVWYLSDWYSNGTTHRCTRYCADFTEGSTSLESLNVNWYCVEMIVSDWGGSWDDKVRQRATASFDATNVSLVRTKDTAGAATEPATEIQITILAIV